MAEAEAILELRRVEGLPANDECRRHAAWKGLPNLKTHGIGGINSRKTCLSRNIVLGSTAVVLLLVIGCQSTLPRLDNLEFINYSSPPSQHHPAKTEQLETVSATAAGADPAESPLSPSLKSVDASERDDDADTPSSYSILSLDTPRSEHAYFGTMFNAQDLDTSRNSHRGLPRSSTLLERVWGDQKNYYSPKSVALLGSGVVVGGLMANTSIDENLHRHFQSSVRGATSDDWFESLHASKELGNGLYTIPLFATAWAAGKVLPDNKLVEATGRWGERSIRGFLVGAPPLIILQQFTGGSRPTETNETSEWHPFRDDNGISGHAFMGSLPFITAAKTTDDRGLKVLFYAGSALTPLSRVNDNAHYPSQVALGWWMAFLAASAVDATDNPNARMRLYPYSTGDGSGMIAEFRY